MPALTREQIEEIISERKFTSLVGARESEFFEVKGSAPYDFTTPEGRYELAKDVSALANSSGGWLMIGLRTTPLQTEAADEVSSLDLVAESEFNIRQIKGLLQDHVYPKINELEVYWAEDIQTANRGVGVIRVPEQKVDTKPFLIAKIVEDGIPVTLIVFGYARRVRDASDPHKVMQLHQAMRDGMSSTAQRLTSLETKVDEILDLLLSRATLPSLLPPEQSLAERTASRIGDILAA